VVDALNTHAIVAATRNGADLLRFALVLLSGLSKPSNVHVKEPARPRLLIEYPTEDRCTPASDEVSSYALHLYLPHEPLT
jgi:hypothetical protein